MDRIKFVSCHIYLKPKRSMRIRNQAKLYLNVHLLVKSAIKTRYRNIQLVCPVKVGI